MLLVTPEKLKASSLRNRVPVSTGALVKWHAVMPAYPLYIPSCNSCESLTWRLFIMKPEKAWGISKAWIFLYH
jgi:hypothetical protein